MESDKKLNLVLEGGGVKGIGLIGAIEEFERQGYTWASIGGTSAGAIVATLLAVGYTGEELHAKLLDPTLDFVEIMDNVSIRQDFFRLLGAKGWLKVTKIPELWRLYSRLKETYGLFDGEYIVDTVRTLIQEKTGKRSYTFSDLANEKGVNATKLNLMVTDITNGRLLILPRDLRKLGSSPRNMEIVKAMRMSMSFPLFFRPVKVSTPKQDIWLMDGGILSNFPIWYIEKLRTRGKEPLFPTVGILLDEGPGCPIGDVGGIVKAVLYTMVSPLDRVGHRAVSSRIVKVNVRNVSTLAFDLKPESKQELYLNGQAAAQEFLRKFRRSHDKKKSTAKFMDEFSREQNPTASQA